MSRPAIPRPHVPLAIGGLLVLLAVAGCSTPPPPPKPIVTTCGEFLALSDADQAYVYKGQKWRYYSPTQAGVVKENEIYAEACLTQPPGTFLDEVLNAADDASCDVFSTLGPDMQTKWLDAVGAEASYKGSVELTVEVSLAACAGFQTKTAYEALRLLEDFPAYATWTSTTTLGYTETMTLAIGQLMSGEKPAHPGITDFIAGGACGYDPTKDAAIPFIVRVTNTTATGPAPAIAAFSFGADSAVATTSSAYVERIFSDGATCADSTLVPISGNEPLETGDELTGYYFVIVKNFFSPLNPQGAYGELPSFWLQSERPLFASDPVVDATPLTMTLDVAGR